MQKILLMLSAVCLLLVSCAGNQYGTMRDNNGYAQSNQQMGVNYLLGRGVPKDNQQAFRYFRQAANEEDDAFAQNEVAYMYAAGKGTHQDHKKAFLYYEKAAKHDLASAQFNLGLLYAYGIGTETNTKLAREWFKKAADHGFEPAQFALQDYPSPSSPPSQPSSS